jgi:hypothetical protein
MDVMANTKDSSLQASGNKVCAYVRQASEAILKAQSGIVNVKVLPLNRDQLVFGHWVSLVLVTAEPFRFVFKTHFMTEDASILASGAKTDRAESHKQHAEQDFIKEYCNVTAGVIKRGFEHQGLTCGISIPLLTRGYIELFFRTLHPSGNSGHEIEDHWTLQHEKASINCSLYFDVTSPSAFLKLPLAFPVPETANDVVFL